MLDKWQFKSKSIVNMPHFRYFSRKKFPLKNKLEMLYFFLSQYFKIFMCISLLPKIHGFDGLCWMDPKFRWYYYYLMEIVAGKFVWFGIVVVAHFLLIRCWISDQEMFGAELWNRLDPVYFRRRCLKLTKLAYLMMYKRKTFKEIWRIKWPFLICTDIKRNEFSKLWIKNVWLKYWCYFHCRQWYSRKYAIV